MDSQKKRLLEKAYHLFFETGTKSVITRPVQEFVDGQVIGIGTAVDEKLRGIGDFRKLLQIQKKQMAGLKIHWEKKRFSSHVTADENTAVYADDVYLTIGTGKKKLKMYLRFSVILHYNGKGWKVIHWHGSKPEEVKSEEDTYGVDQWKKKASELQQLVEQRTADLLMKNRELEIEASLEKVRTVAMGMKERADMLKICTIIAKQLSVLGLKEIRNVQTAIFKVPMGTYVNYEFYAKHDKTFITETLYTNHKVALAFAKKMLKGKGAVAIAHMKGKQQVMDWLRYQKSTNVFIDTFLKKATSLSYYWYSLGPVALGISTYQPLSKDELQLFQRFLKVFELAYQRYLDIENAEAQVREAQIEAALERVRARSMAMQDSSEIGKLILHVYTELTKLDARLDRCFFMIVNPENLGISWWMASQEGLLAENGFFVQYNEHPSHQLYLNHWKKRTKKWHYLFAGKEKRDWDRFGFSKTELSRLPEPVKQFMASAKSVNLSGSSDAFGSLVTGSFEPLSDEHQDIISRFASVFNQTYTRFNDLKKAEAQARESQIEAALERIRSRTVGMQKSEELKEVIQVVYEQFIRLGIHTEHAGFIIDYRERNDYNTWIADQFGSPSQIAIPYFDCIYYNQFNAAKAEQKEFFALSLTRKEKDRFYKGLFKLIPGFPEASKQIIFHHPGFTISTVLLENVALYIENFTGLPYAEEDNAILIRFGKVFQQTYTRFLDLQKAEEQAHEAEVQLALERVRARSLAMHQTSELMEVVNEVAQQLMKMKIDIDGGIFIVINEEVESDRLPIWGAAGAANYVEKVIVPELGTAIFTILVNAILKRESFLTERYTREEKGAFLHNLFKHAPWKQLPAKRKKELLARKGGYCRSTVISKFTSIAMINHHGKEFSAADNLILQRFGMVLEQSYTRFLDLQKAEEQSKESLIQLALERVRARTMAMQQSTELPEAANLLFHQLKALDMPAWSAGYCIWEDDKKAVTLWMSSEGVLQPPFKAPTTEDELFIQMREGHEQGKPLHVVELGGKKLQAHYQYMRSLPVVGEVLDSIIEAGHPLPVYQVMHYAYFSKGYLLFITYEPVPAAHEIFKRFANVFDQTYTRFLDLQKAEAQTRESQIEVAVERVRAKALAMHRSEEILQVAMTLKEQMEGLELKGVTAATIYLQQDDGLIRAWDITELKESAIGPQLTVDFAFKLEETDPHLWVRRIWGATEKYSVIEMSGNDFSICERWLRSFDAKAADHYLQFIKAADLKKSWHPTVPLEKGKLNIDFILPPPAEMEFILPKMGAAFDLAYRRFLDLQKAESQAREAQIETALERVRSRAMAMHFSDELKEVALELRKQMGLLGQKDLEVCAIHLYGLDENSFESWSAMRAPGSAGEIVQGQASFPKSGIGIIDELMEKQAAGDRDYILVNEREKMVEWFAVMKQYVPEMYDSIISLIGDTPQYEMKAYWSVADFAGGALVMVTYSEPDEQTRNLLRRTANVFELAYTRFVDLKKAEAQTREAQIEAALEKVRSRTMAMQSSNELQETAAVLFQEFRKLGAEDMYQVTIGIYDEASQLIDFRVTSWSGSGEQESRAFQLDMNEPTVLKPAVQAWKNQQKSVVIDLSGEALEGWLQYRNKMSGITVSSADTGGRRVISAAFYSKGHLSISTREPVSAETLHTLERFAAVFDTTYTRFQDLQKAEAQTKEAQIELALERVRARTMAMQRSDELSEVVKTIYEQLQHLDFNASACNIVIADKISGDREFWIAGFAEDKYPESYKVPYFNHPYIVAQLDAWKQGEKYAVFEYEGEMKKQFDEIFFSATDFRNVPDDAKKIMIEIPSVTFSTAFFNYGYLQALGSKAVSAENADILKRFARVFEQAYTRFLDLQKAEAQAKEASIEAALERVRSRTLAMQKSDELAETAAVLFQQLIALGIEPNRLYIILIKENNAEMEAWVTDEDGSKVSMGFTGNYNRNSSLLKMYEGWKEKRTSLVIDMQGEELQQYFHYLHDELHVPFKGGLEQKRRIQHIVYFSHGLIGMASPEEQPIETLQLMERFAAVFNLTFTRFNDLKIAEAHAAQAEQDLIAIKEAKQKAEEALTELQATQKQLIQSEKMASLGELTAGIAHEIQNPLNFVNNFSEVSKELLDEIKEELEKGNLDDAKEIMQDVIQNLEKINHHGKRADGIVKGMLQHSRTGSGQMEPTDINALCDEYLRLSYHGLRAKDKSFNARFETHFDQSIGKINVLPQDLGRVILNLINNAFYAVSAKASAKADSAYEPTVEVSTTLSPLPGRGAGGEVSIIVKDNGTGIPQKVLDKIFQPFFTTKPTGQGTGLGLSLSYDIVKAHGGEIIVETTEGEGTNFRILLPV